MPTNLDDIFAMKILPIILQFKNSSIENELFMQKEFFMDVHFLAVSEKKKLEESVEKMIQESPEKFEIL